MYSYRLKTDRETAIEVIKNQIKLLDNIIDNESAKTTYKQIIRNISSVIDSEDTINRLKVKSIYQENEYSIEINNKNLIKAKERVGDFLEEIMENLVNDDSETVSIGNEFSKDIAFAIIRRVLVNFHMHIAAMYQANVHKKAGITKENLDKIKVVNEYDVQRILYSLIKPIFPSVRSEVCDDMGVSNVRYDISIAEYSIAIETKCSRKNMTERELTEEIAADIVHYKYSNIFFFIYDKEKIIRNKTAFEDTYTRVFDGKNVTTIICQPMIL